MIDKLLDEINECGTLMEKHELLELAYGVFGETVYIEDGDGFVIDTERKPNFQAVADIYANGFDCENY